MVKIVIVLLLLINVFFGCSSPKNTHKVMVEILYMNHGPVQPVLAEMRPLFQKYESCLSLHWYDYDKDISFKNSKGVDYHVPIVIWINGLMTYTDNGNEITFKGFPKNTGPDFARGNWDLQSLEKTIQSVCGAQ